VAFHQPAVNGSLVGAVDFTDRWLQGRTELDSRSWEPRVAAARAMRLRPLDGSAYGYSSENQPRPPELTAKLTAKDFSFRLSQAVAPGLGGPRGWVSTDLRTHNPKVAGSNPATATIETAGQAGCRSGGTPSAFPEWSRNGHGMVTSGPWTTF
jgi:hypothetical protein